MQNRFWNLIPWCLTERRSLIASVNMNVIVRSLTFVELRTECSFHIVQTVFDKNIMSVWSSAKVTGDRIPAGLTFFRGYDRKSIICFCLWGCQIDRAVCRGKINWIAILKTHVGKIIAFVINKYLMLFITYMMFNIQQCEMCHFCTSSGTKCNLTNNLFWRKYN